MVQRLFHHIMSSTQSGTPVELLTVRRSHNGYRIECHPRFAETHGLRPECHNRQELRQQLKLHVVQSFIDARPDLLWLHCAAVTRHGRAILIAGAWGSGKSAISVEMCRRGWSYLSDDITPIHPDTLRVLPFPLTPMVRRPTSAWLPPERVHHLEKSFVDVPVEGIAGPANAIEAVIFPAYAGPEPTGAFAVRRGSALLTLLAGVLNFGRHDETVDGPAVALEIRTRDPKPAGPRLAVREPTPWDGVARRLSIGMATFDDFDGAYFTIQSIRLHHPEIADAVEILVVDDNPEGAAAKPLRALAAQIPGYRYLPNFGRGGTSARERVMREAASPHVMCIDSHVLIAPGALQRLLGYFEAHPDCPDLLQGPMIYDDLKSLSTHFEPKWRAGMFGIWGTDPRGTDPAAEPFEIAMQGLGLFACRRDAWPGLNPRFAGFGGEEGYIHEKFRRAGGRVLCLPFLRWLHRFPRPRGVPYRNVWEERIRNYYIGFEELGLPTQELATHFTELIGVEPFARCLSQVRAELDGPFHLFDAIRCINLDSESERWDTMQAHLASIGAHLAQRIQRLPAVSAAPDPQAGRALSHRRAIEEARARGLANVLVLEDDTYFPGSALERLARSVADLQRCEWDVFYLGGSCDDWPSAPGSRHLRQAGEVHVRAHAVAYHSRIFDALLAALPAVAPRGAGAGISIDRVLRGLTRRYVAHPPAAYHPPSRHTAVEAASGDGPAPQEAGT
jgi:hypothetical protein